MIFYVGTKPDLRLLTQIPPYTFYLDNSCRSVASQKIKHTVTSVESAIGVNDGFFLIFDAITLSGQLFHPFVLDALISFALVLCSVLSASLCLLSALSLFLLIIIPTASCGLPSLEHNRNPHSLHLPSSSLMEQSSRLVQAGRWSLTTIRTRAVHATACSHACDHCCASRAIQAQRSP